MGLDFLVRGEYEIQVAMGLDFLKSDVIEINTGVCRYPVLSMEGDALGFLRVE